MAQAPQLTGLQNAFNQFINVTQQKRLEAEQKRERDKQNKRRIEAERAAHRAQNIQLGITIAGAALGAGVGAGLIGAGAAPTIGSATIGSATIGGTGGAGAASGALTGMQLGAGVGQLVGSLEFQGQERQDRMLQAGTNLAIQGLQLKAQADADADTANKLKLTSEALNTVYDYKDKTSIKEQYTKVNVSLAAANASPEVLRLARDDYEKALEKNQDYSAKNSFIDAQKSFYNSLPDNEIANQLKAKITGYGESSLSFDQTVKANERDEKQIGLDESTKKSSLKVYSNSRLDQLLRGGDSPTEYEMVFNAEVTKRKNTVPSGASEVANYEKSIIDSTEKALSRKYTIELQGAKTEEYFDPIKAKYEALGLSDNTQAARLIAKKDIHFSREKAARAINDDNGLAVSEQVTSDDQLYKGLIEKEKNKFYRNKEKSLISSLFTQGSEQKADAIISSSDLTEQQKTRLTGFVKDFYDDKKDNASNKALGTVAGLLNDNNYEEAKKYIAKNASTLGDNTEKANALVTAYVDWRLVGLEKNSSLYLEAKKQFDPNITDDLIAEVKKIEEKKAKTEGKEDKDISVPLQEVYRSIKGIEKNKGGSSPTIGTWFGEMWAKHGIGDEAKEMRNLMLNQNALLLNLSRLQGDSLSRLSNADRDLIRTQTGELGQTFKMTEEQIKLNKIKVLLVIRSTILENKETGSVLDGKGMPKALTPDQINRLSPTNMTIYNDFATSLGITQQSAKSPLR